MLPCTNFPFSSVIFPLLKTCDTVVSFKLERRKKVHPHILLLCTIHIRELIACYPLFSLIGIPFPTPIKSISKVEEQNGLTINVFGYEEAIYPLYLSSCDGVPINLFFFRFLSYGRGASTNLTSRQGRTSPCGHRTMEVSRTLPYFHPYSILYSQERSLR